MRPRYLEVEGLQSFKDAQCIDFDRLSEMGLFGIFGPTGSGKSTILDAITLALYGNVQRAARGTQGIINTAMSDMRVLLVFDLVKEGKRKTYKIERAYRRKKDSDTSIESRLARFIEIEDSQEHILADKLSEVNTYIVDLLGLQFDDFTRSVVLPQNKFQEFLLSPKSEKTKMLERIFYLEEYGRQLNDKLSRKLAFIKTRYSVLEGAISVLGDASHEALINAQNKMKEAQEQKIKIADELKLLEEKHQSAKEARELLVELDKLLPLEKEHASQKTTIDAAKAAYERAIKASSLYDMISSYRELEKSLGETEEKLKKAELEEKKSEAELKALSKSYEEKNSILKQKLPELIEYKTKLNSCMHIKHDIDEIADRLKCLRESYLKEKDSFNVYEKTVVDTRKSIEVTANAINEHKKHLESKRISVEYRRSVQSAMTLQDNIEKLEEDKKNKYKEYIEQQGVVDKLKSDMENLLKDKSLLIHQLENKKNELELHRENNPVEKKQISISEEDYYKARTTVDSISSKYIYISDLCKRREDFLVHLGKGKSDKESIESEMQQLQIQREQIEKKLQEYKTICDGTHAQMLALELKKDKPCPVCGSTVHPSPADYAASEIDEAYIRSMEQLKTEKTVLEEGLSKLFNNFVRIEERAKGLLESINQTELDIENQKSEIDIKREDLPEEMQQLEVEALKKYLENVKLRYEELKEAAAAWEQEKEVLVKGIAKLDEELREKKVVESRISTQLDLSNRTLQRVDNAFNSISESLKEKNCQYDEFIKSIGILHPKEAMKKIEEDEHSIELHQCEIERLQRQEQQYRGQLDNAAEQRSKLASKLADIEAEGRGLRQQKESNEKKLMDVLEDKNLNEELKGVEEEIIRLQQEEKEARIGLSAVTETYNLFSASLKSLENEKSLLNSKIIRDQNKLFEALREKGFNAIKQAEEFLMSTDKLELLNRDIKEYQDEALSIETRKLMLLNKLKGRTVTAEEWENISDEYAGKLKDKEDAISNYENARMNYEGIKSNYEKWLKLNKEYKQIKQKRERLEQIQKLLKGNSFIEFISEERLRYIAREASETLGILTKHKYALELDIENGFVVRDNANGGVLRMVSSLSGGETFLTSLSLALALSSQLQLKGQSPLEFFFLDEGFGTLDNSLLDVVIDSLERLGNTKRVIGLISHVPELKNRISRRLIIEPPSREGIGSKVSIEKA